MRNEVRLLYSATLMALTVACTYAPPIAPVATQVGSPEPLWTKKLKGYITDLALSADGKVTLIAMAPNRDADDGQKFYSVNRFDGKSSWSLKPSAPVKSLALSKDGALAVVSTYNDRITAYGPTGKELWSAEGTCRPVMASIAERIICYHDDDAEPRTAFDVYDLAGKKRGSYSITQDILAFELSFDERNLAIGLNGGKVVVFDRDFRPLWEKTVSGEIADVGISSGADPRVAVLYHRSGKSRDEGRIAIFDSAGSLLGEAEPTSHADQVEFSLDGSAVLAEGKNRKGQYVGMFPVPTLSQRSFAEKWNRVFPSFSDNTGRVVVAQGQVIVSFEESYGSVRKSRLVSLELPGGGERWRADVPMDEGAFLYSSSVSLTSRILVVGSDDGRLAAFRFH